MSSALSDIESKIAYMAKVLRAVIAALSLVASVGLLGATGGAQQQAPPTQPPPSQQPPPAQQSPTQQPPPAQQPPAQQPPADPSQPPTFRTGINFVRVDVIITDKNGNNI